MSEPVIPEYVICMYIRLSSEDDDIKYNDAKNESNSITAQRKMLYDYIGSRIEFRDCKVIERCDDGFSGTHFDTRPQFTDMIEMAKRGEINCIIVKDFSRFGRDYIELGDYMEQFFPTLGIRFISVNDNYDSDLLSDGELGGIDVSFKNLIYDYYARETSKKEKLSWKNSAEKGEYRASVPLYGYKKSKDNHLKLEIDPEAARVVKEIFDMKLSGMTLTEYKGKKQSLDAELTHLMAKKEQSVLESKEADVVELLIKKFCDADTLTEEMKELLIEKILVYSNNVLEIYWKADFIKYFSDTSRIIGKETGKNE